VTSDATGGWEEAARPSETIDNGRMLSDVLAYYKDLVTTGLPVAMCWTVTQPLGVALTLEDVASRLGGDPDDLEVLDLSEAYEIGPNDGWVLHLDQVGPAVTIFENNGFQGARSEVLRALSIDAKVHSAWWNVNAVTRFSFARQGELITAMEAGWPRAGVRPNALDAELADLYDAMRTPGLWVAGMLTAVELRTGIRLDREWFDRPHEAIVIART